MFGLLLEDMPGFDKSRLEHAPTDPERRLVWAEQEASAILFGPCLQKCAAAAKQAFVGKFFGAAAAAAPAKTTIRVTGAAKAAGGAGAPAATKTKYVDTYLMDKFLVATMKKTDSKSKASGLK
jgi:hypothetical protein